MAKNLVIVESPAKAKTLEKVLGPDFKVKSSYGHIRDLPSKGMNIDIESGKFTPTYAINDDKKKVISELRRAAKGAEVWLAADEDREGEAIAWHVCSALKLDPKKTKRIVFHEITKPAILAAVKNPRIIDQDLVDAQQARRILDRLVGYELSPVLWKKIQAGLSAGRVQSVAVRLIVDRERSIEEFDSQSTFRVTAEFDLGKGSVLKAELPKKFATYEEAEKFLQTCVGADFSVKDLESKPAKKSPAAPFTTSTLQQEASRKMGFSVANTMRAAQKLYEAGKITYMRTDSLNLSDLAVEGAVKEIEKSYGKEFVQTRKYKTKSKGAQEAHEAIRPTDFSVKSAGKDPGESRLYDLIWKRAIASQMADAKIEKTTAIISISTTKTELKAKGEVVIFAGFLDVYFESSDDENEENPLEKKMLPKINVGQELKLMGMVGKETYSHPPARYTEASLVKKMEEEGIGRPSTYAPTISTIQNRKYVEKGSRDGREREARVLTLAKNEITNSAKIEMAGVVRNKLMPTDLGEVVTDFLIKYFPNVVDYGFTRKVETQFDEVATGKMIWHKMIKEFYTPFHETIEASGGISRESAMQVRELGIDPKSKKPVFARLGRFGPMVQIGTKDDEEKPAFASIPASMSIKTITLEQSLELFNLPRKVGTTPEGEEILANNGRFGPYIKFDGTYVSLPKDEDPVTVSLETAMELITAKKLAEAPIAEYEGMPVQKNVGRFGPYIKWNGIFINVNKRYDFDNLTQEDIVSLIEEKKQKEIDKVVHNWEEEGIRVEKARWGRHNIIKGKIKIELDKSVNAPKLTLEKVQKIIEMKTKKKKKTPAKKKAVKKK